LNNPTHRGDVVPGKSVLAEIVKNEVQRAISADEDAIGKLAANPGEVRSDCTRLHAEQTFPRHKA